IAFVLALTTIIKNLKDKLEINQIHLAIILCGPIVLFMIDAKLFLILLLVFIIVYTPIKLFRNKLTVVGIFLLFSVTFFGVIKFAPDLPISILYFKGYKLNTQEYKSNIKSTQDRKSTRLNSSHVKISYDVFCLKKKKNIIL